MKFTDARAPFHPSMLSSSMIVRQQWSKLLACCVAVAILLAAVAAPAGLLLSHGAFSDTSLETLVGHEPDSPSHAPHTHVHAKHAADHGHDTAITMAPPLLSSPSITHAVCCDLTDWPLKPSGERMERPPRA